MAIYPGRVYVNDTVRLEVNWQNDSGVDLDPTTDVTLKIRSPSGTTSTYTYSDAEITKSSAGDYYYDLTPDKSGRWWFRWEASGTGTNKALEGSLMVQVSVFYDDSEDAYR